jgi:hypothetical protein
MSSGKKGPYAMSAKAEAMKPALSLVARQLVTGEITEHQAGNHVADLCMLGGLDDFEKLGVFYEAQVTHFGGRKAEDEQRKRSVAREEAREKATEESTSRMRGYLANGLGISEEQLPGLEGAVLSASVELKQFREKADVPIPMQLPCPGTVPDGRGGLRVCGQLHIDEGEFATKPHHTHSCQHCGHNWRPAVVKTFGVRFLPGFKNEKPPEGGVRHMPGCGTVARGCVRGCPNWDPRFDS